MIGEVGLIWKLGHWPLLISRIHLTIQSLKCSSLSDWAVLLFQKSIRRVQTGCSPFLIAYQTRDAHTAPPEVPLRLTISNSSWIPASNSACRTPAVKAVWLPPPWQVMAIFVFMSVRVGHRHSKARSNHAKCRTVVRPASSDRQQPHSRKFFRIASPSPYNTMSAGGAALDLGPMPWLQRLLVCCTGAKPRLNGRKQPV